MLVYIKPVTMFPKLHSDRLFGAIFATINEIFPSKLDDIKKDFESDNPPFLISSTFPVLDINDSKIKFFPKIILKRKSEVDSIIEKDYKKVDYMEESIFFDLINGNISEEDILNNYDDYSRVKNLLMLKGQEKKIEMTQTLVPHNSINRLNNETDIFYSEGLVYGKDNGLFFIIDVFDESYVPIIKSCLKFLKDRGFGADISTGRGQFTYEIENVDLNIQDDEINNGDKFITLSRFIPTSNDLKNIGEESCYEIASKRSIDKSGDKRKQIHYFKEGSIFLHYKRFYGQIVDSGSYKPAIEYGYAFPIKYVDGGN